MEVSMQKTHEKKRKLINSWQASGLSVTQWCKNKHRPIGTFSEWKTKLKKTNPVQLKAQDFMSIDNKSSDVGVELQFEAISIKLSKNFDPDVLARCLGVIRRLGC